MEKGNGRKVKIVRVESERERVEGMLNLGNCPVFVRVCVCSFVCEILGKKDSSTLSFGNMVCYSVMRTRKCRIIPKLPRAYVSLLK